MLYTDWWFIWGTQALYPGSVPGFFSQGLYSGAVPRCCIQVLYPGPVHFVRHPLPKCCTLLPGCCIHVMYPNSLPRCCTLVLYSGAVPYSCTRCCTPCPRKWSWLVPWSSAPTPWTSRPASFWWVDQEDIYILVDCTVSPSFHNWYKHLMRLSCTTFPSLPALTVLLLHEFTLLQSILLLLFHWFPSFLPLFSRSPTPLGE